LVAMVEATAFVSRLPWTHRTLSYPPVIRRAPSVSQAKKGRVVMNGITADWNALEERIAAAEKREDIDAMWLDARLSDPHGPLNPAATRDGTLRLFDAKEESDVQLTLYRDPAYWCPYCERLSMQLEVKRIPHRIRTINMRCYGQKPPYYLAMVPSGLLPAVEYQGRVYTESLDIMLMIEDEFPNHNPLLPPDGRQNKVFKALMQMEREAFAWWCTWAWRSDSVRGKRGFEAVLDAWNDALVKVDSSGPFLFGKSVSLMDILAIPFYERYIASIYAFKGYRIRGQERYAAIDAWMAAMERDVQSFAATKADFYSTVWDLPPQMGNPCINADGDAAREVIDGRDGSWDLPLSPLTDDCLEPVAYLAPADRGGLAPQFHFEAAAKVVRNSTAVARFAARGCGELPKTVSAPLSDPDARPNEAVIDDVDEILRCVCESMLSQAESSSDEVAVPQLPSAVESWSSERKANVAIALSYMRDRVGVPRDLRFPSARILRAYLHHYVKRLK